MRRTAGSLLAATLAAGLLVGTSRMAWSTSSVEAGPGFELDSDESSIEFNIELALDMCEPGPQGEPVGLFLDLSYGFDGLASDPVDTADSSTVSVVLYPGDGSPIASDELDMSAGSAGSYISSGKIQCPAFGLCERSYVVVFSASEGTSVSGWWTLTASAMGPSQSQGEYQGEISIEITER